MNALLGTELDAEDVWDSLAPLGIELDATGDGADRDASWRCPTFRPDLEREIDLVEEVARRVGLRPHRPHGAATPTEGRRAHARQQRAPRGRRRARRRRARRGVHAAAARAGRPRARRCAADAVIEVENPLRAEESVLRPALLPGLLRRSRATPRTASPTSRCSRSGRVFFTPLGPRRRRPLPDEREHLALALAGTRAPPPGRGRPPGRRVRRGRCRHRGRRCAWGSTTSTLEPADLRRPSRRRGGPGRRRRRTRSAPSARSRPRWSTRSGSPAPVVACELDARRAPRRAPAATARPRRRRASRRRRSTSRSSSPTTCPAADVVRTLRAAVGDLLEDVRAVRRVPFGRARRRAA